MLALLCHSSENQSRSFRLPGYDKAMPGELADETSDERREVAYPTKRRQVSIRGITYKRLQAKAKELRIPVSVLLERILKEKGFGK